MARTAVSPLARDGAGGGGSSNRTADGLRAQWRAAFARVRGETEQRASHLSAEDQIVQSMADDGTIASIVRTVT